MAIRKIVRDALEETLAALNWPIPEKLVIEEPKNRDHGDLSINAAMLLAKSLHKSPRVIAGQLVPELKKNCPFIEKIEIADPGFCNLHLTPAAWQSIITEVEKTGGAFGHSQIGKGKKAMVEYVSANPTGPLHIGHGRGAAVGDSAARLLRAAGYNVATEYYLNDAGRQMRLLGKSIWKRVLELAGEKVIFPEDCYKGEYICNLAAALLKSRPELPQLEENEAQEICREYGMNVLLGDIRQDMARFRCEHQRFFSEKSLVEDGSVQATFERLAEKGCLLEQDGALWFDSVSSDADEERVLRKSDGSLTYFATDIAYHEDKFKRGFDWLIDVWGADHHGYIPRMKAAIQQMGHEPKKFHVLLVQLVNLLKNGEAIPMSTRAGTFITLKQLLDEVGVDPTRFLFLSRSCDSPLDFDIEIARKRSMDNPVYYVQYAHARVCSLLRRAEEREIYLSAQTDPAILSRLTEPAELAILRLLDNWEDTVANAAQNVAPHHIARYVEELAKRMHAYYAKHNILGQDDEKLILARLALLRAAGQTLRNGLFLLGVSAPDAM